jgi:hypothetical protein
VAKAGLHFVADQKRLVACTPLAQRLHVLHRRERGAAALVGFKDHAGHVARLHVVLAQGAFEAVEGIVGGAETVGKRDLHKAGIQVDDPFFQHRDAAGLLGAEGAAVEGFVVGDNHVLAAPAGLGAVTAAHLDGAFHGF